MIFTDRIKLHRTIHIYIYTLTHTHTSIHTNWWKLNVTNNMVNIIHQYHLPGFDNILPLSKTSPLEVLSKGYIGLFMCVQFSESL